jgi:ABC-type lipoprotein release transport system permease subunit
LATAALATAVSLPVVLLSVGNGVILHEIRALDNSGYQIVVTTAGVHGIADAHSLMEQFQRISGVSAVSPILSSAVDIFPGGGLCTPVLAEGIVPAGFQSTEGSTSRLFPNPLPLGDPTDTAHYSNGSYAGPMSRDVLVSTPLAQNCSISLGSRVVLSPSSNASNGGYFNVSGFFGVPPASLGPAAAFVVILPLSDLQVLTGLARTNGTGTLLDSADTVQIALAGSGATDPSQLSGVAHQIQRLVPYYTVTTLKQQASELRSGNAVLNGFYLALSSVALAVGLIFLALVLLRRVESQRRSIGIRRAIGVPGFYIAQDMMGHASILAATGSVAGLAGGYLVVRLLAMFATSTVQTAASLALFDPVTLAELVLAVEALSLVAAGLATRAALRVSLPEALR